MVSTFVLASRSSSICPSAWPSQAHIPLNSALRILAGSLASTKGCLQFCVAALDDDKDGKKGKLKGYPETKKRAILSHAPELLSIASQKSTARARQEAESGLLSHSCICTTRAGLVSCAQPGHLLSLSQGWSSSFTTLDLGTSKICGRPEENRFRAQLQSSEGKGLAEDLI